jgi:hypothetical protein
VEEDFDTKPITREGIPAAIERAQHYRLLNQPDLAESICLDVLEIEPENQEALVVAILAITDQFAHGGPPGVGRAREHLTRVTDDYQRSYYAGIIAERWGRAILTRGPAGKFAYNSLREAMDWFEKAALMRPAGNDDAILRWNACVRSIRLQRLQPLPEEAEIGLE